MTEKYEPRNILITGGAGFIGSNIVRDWLERYPAYRLVNVDILSPCSSLNGLPSTISEKYKFVQANICDQSKMLSIIRQYDIDTIVHAAALTHVDNSFTSGLEFTQNNVLGTHVLLESARLASIRRFLYVSTDEVYGEVPDTNSSRKESDEMRPTNPYAATKASAEFLVRSYYQSFNIPILITRGNNAYGPGQYPEKIIPKAICRRIQNKSWYLNNTVGDPSSCSFVHGDGRHVRRYLYVTDVVRAIDTILHFGHVGETYNIGSDFEISNNKLVKKIIHDMNGNDETDIEYVHDRAYNDFRYAVDCTKLLRLGWRPEVDFERGLEMTSTKRLFHYENNYHVVVQWYREHYGGSWWLDWGCVDKPHETM